MRRLGSSLRTLVHRRCFEDDMAEELRFHIEQYTADLVGSGVPPREAARRARIEFGSVDTAKDGCREARGLWLFDEIVRDVRYAVRLLWRAPGFTVAALATLAICLGANLTVFAVVDSILLRPLPFPAADRLVRVFNSYPKAGVPDDGCSVTNYYERRGKIAAFMALAAYRDGTAIVGETGATEREQVTQVTPDFFTTLGRGPVLGRAFTDEEMAENAGSVVILTDTFWRQRFSGDPHVIGRTMRLDGSPATVIGVLPADFRFLSSQARLYIPLTSRPEERTPERRHSGSSTHMIARLKPGITLAETQAEIDAHNAAMEVGDPQAKIIADAGFHSIMVPLHADHVAAVRPTLLLVQAGALFLLLIGAVNLVNLLLIRASGRAKEAAVRQALGASRRRVVSEAMVETTVLTLAGGLLGLVVGAAGVRLLAVLGTDRLPLGTHVAFDLRLALAGLAGAIGLGLAIAGPVAWYNLRAHPARALQSESRGATAGRAAQRMRHGFIIAQIALAFVLLSGTGLLGLSLKKAMAISPGFRPENVLSGRLYLPGMGGAARLAFIDRLMGEVGRQPGVLAAGVVTEVPLGGNNIKSAVTVKGHRLQPGESARGHYTYGVGGDYFNVLGFNLREGRVLTAADTRHAERVCVVDEDFARRYWPNSSAIGQRLFPGPQEGTDAEAYTIVGVVAAVKQAGLTDEDAQGAVFFPYSGRFDDNLFVVLHTSRPPESLAATLRSAVRKVDPELPVTDLRSMESRIADSLVARRSPALLAGLFSGIALLLTALGTYGVLSYSVAQRRREIGLRMALGARPEQVRDQFVSLSLRLLANGTVLGVFGAWLTGQAMQAVLFHVPAFHLATVAGTAGILGVVSLFACLLPSQRAARISPMVVLSEG